MKYFLILFTFLISLNAFADREIGFDITTMKNQGSKPANPKVGHGKVFLKNGKLVSIDSNGKETQYGVNGTLVKNSSFESFTALEDWSVSTITPTRTTNSRVTGEYGIEFTASAAQQGLFQYVDIPPSLVGELLEYSFYTQSNEDVEVCSLNDSVVSVCKTYYGNSSQGMRKVIVTDRPKNTNANANGVLLRTKTANLSNVKADDAHIGLPKSDEAIVAKFDNTTGWVNLGATVWRATTTAPTKSSTSIDRLQGKRNGSNLDLRLEFRNSAAGGAAGSGVYQLEIPSTFEGQAITLDFSKISGIAPPTSTGANADIGSSVGSGILHYGGDAIQNFHVIPLTNGRFAFKGAVTTVSGATAPYWFGSGLGSAFTVATGQITANFSIPIAEWSSQTNAAIVACKEGPLKCTNRFTFIYNGTNASDQFGNVYTVTKSETSNRAKEINVSSLGLTNGLRCVSSSGAGNANVGLTQTGISNTTTSVYVQTFTYNGSNVDYTFSIDCTKQGSDFNEAYERVVIKKDDADIRNVEWLTGGFNYIDNKPIYKRCYAVASNITTDNTTLATWQSGLNPLTPEDAVVAGLYQFEGTSTNDTGYAGLLYNKTSGIVRTWISSGSTLRAGRNLCLTYTK